MKNWTEFSRKIKKLQVWVWAKTKTINELVSKISDLVSEEPVDEEAFNGDSIDRIDSKLKEISKPLLEQFKEIFEEKKEKKDLSLKLLKYSPFCWLQRRNLRRTGRPAFIPAPDQRKSNKNMNRRLRTAPYKLKKDSCHKQSKSKLKKMAMS